MAALSTLALAAVAAARTASNFSAERSAAKGAQAAGDAQASLLETNATLADNQATDALQRGHEASSNVFRQTRLLGGAQRSAFAAQGVDLGAGGSVNDVIEGDQALGALDRLTIENNAAREAWGFRTQAASSRSQAGYARAAGSNAAQGYRRQSAGTLLGGAGELADIWQSAPKSVGAGSGPYTASGARRGAPL